MEKVRRRASRFKGRAQLWEPVCDAAERLKLDVTNLLCLGRLGVIPMRCGFVEVWGPAFVALEDGMRRCA